MLSTNLCFGLRPDSSILPIQSLTIMVKAVGAIFHFFSSVKMSEESSWKLLATVASFPEIFPLI